MCGGLSMALELTRRVDVVGIAGEAKPVCFYYS